MSRIKQVQSYLNMFFDHIDDSENKRSAYIHSYGVVSMCLVTLLRDSLVKRLSVNA